MPGLQKLMTCVSDSIYIRAMTGTPSIMCSSELCSFALTRQILCYNWMWGMVREMATHSSILAWEIPWTEEPGGYSLWGCKELDTTWQEWMKKKNGDFPGGSSG